MLLSCVNKYYLLTYQRYRSAWEFLCFASVCLPECLCCLAATRDFKEIVHAIWRDLVG